MALLQNSKSVIKRQNNKLHNVGENEESSRSAEYSKMWKTSVFEPGNLLQCTLQDKVLERTGPGRRRISWFKN